ncbi:MAG TPA: hypothetical protein VM841_06680 [Actinomycetota bacterium]|nr:hypothetical protein [Actinomycetota bacterium]
MQGIGKAANPGAPRLRVRRALLRLVVVAVVAPAVFTALPDAPATADGGMRTVGTLDRRTGLDSIAANGNILIEAKARRGWQASLREGRMLLFEVDLDSLKLLSTTEIPELMPAVTTSGPTEWQWRLEESTRRIIAIERTVDPQLRLEAHRLIWIDLRTKKVTQGPQLWPGSTRFPLALATHDGGKTVYLLTRAPTEVMGRTRLWLEERALDGTRRFEYLLDDCFNAQDMQYAPVLARSRLRPGTIYVTCYGPGNVQAQVLRVTLTAAGPAGVEVFPGVPGPLSAQFDAGSDRVFFLTTNGGAGRGAWVFDGLRSSFLGVIASGDNRVGASDYAMGIDPATGRLYMETPAGFLIADARRTPLPAGLLFRELAGQVIGSIHVDPVTRRVFLPSPFVKNPQGQSTEYLILKDTIRVSKDPPPGDPDALTADVAERKGVTDVNYTGGARAFAMRALTTGGAQRMVWNLALGQFSPEDRGFDAAAAAVATVPLDQSNRDLYAARVHNVSIGNASSEAAASFGHADAGTLRDAERAGRAWPFPAAECRDDAGRPESKNEAGSSASCDLDATSVTGASALTGSATDEGALLSTRALVAFGNVSRNERDGLVARAIAVVQDVSIGNRVRIGEIRAEALTRAKGRPGTAAGSFERFIENVRIDTDGNGTVDFTCELCRPQAVAAAIEQALPGQVKVEFPSPDTAWFGGSKRGYQAVVQKETFRGYAEKTLNDDDAPEVTGMQVTFFADGRAGRSRQVVQLAGVQAESHYGIYLLGQDAPEPEPEPEPSVEPVPTVEPTVDAPVPPPPAPVVKGTKTVTETFVRRIAAGSALALAKPKDALLLGALWLFLGLPAYLILRRRHVGAR